MYFPVLAAGCWAALAAVLALMLVYVKSCATPPLTEDGMPVLSPVRALHVALLAVLALFICNTAIAASFIDGVSRQGTTTTSTVIGVFAFGDLASTSIMVVLLLVSRGWQVTRLHIDSNERRSVVFLVMLYFLSCLTYQIMYAK